MNPTRNIFRHIAVMMILAVALALAAIAPRPAFADTSNVAVGAGSEQTIILHISGQYTSTTASVTKFKMPYPAQVLGVGAYARASGGTSPTLTVDVKNGGVSILSAPITVTATNYTEGTVATAKVADEAVLSVDLTIGGTSPTWNDITVVVTVARR